MRIKRDTFFGDYHANFSLPFKGLQSASGYKRVNTSNAMRAEWKQLNSGGGSDPITVELDSGEVIKVNDDSFNLRLDRQQLLFRGNLLTGPKDNLNGYLRDHSFTEREMGV